MGKYVTGVVSNHSPEWLWDEVYYEDSTIHLDCESCEYRSLENGCDGCEIEQDYLIGGWRKVDGFFEPDTDTEYSAIVRAGSNVTQVIHSNWAQPCHKCSPCYPGQGDLDTSGDYYLAYTLPPDVWGNGAPDGIRWVA